MISVVIPTLDAERELPATLEALVPGAVAGVISEVIVVDGGSSDQTETIADHTGCRWIEAPKGRGQQLAEGATHVRSSWLLFLHADSVLIDGWMKDVASFIHETEKNDLNKAAVFRFALSSRRGGARIVEAGVRVRSWLFALPYGDQGLLISKQLYEKIGGYKNITIMEDVDIVRRLGRRRIVVLPSRVVTSAVRYEREGFLPRSLRNLFCLALYLFGVSPEKIRRIYG